MDEIITTLSLLSTTLHLRNEGKFCLIKQKLIERDAFIDMKEYHIDNTAKILGILAAMIEQKA